MRVELPIDVRYIAYVLWIFKKTTKQRSQREMLSAFGIKESLWVTSWYGRTVQKKQPAKMVSVDDGVVYNSFVCCGFGRL